VKYSETIDHPYCTITRTAAILCEPWTLIIVKEVTRGLSRFEDLQSSLEAPRAILADRLVTLVEHQVLIREPYVDAQGRTRTSYQLTEAGEQLLPVLMAFRQWGDQHMAPDGPPLRWEHKDCGGTPAVAVTCSVCGQHLTQDDLRGDLAPTTPPPAPR
jgi:DNA-binding HxlR family transcriptional regulator